MRKIDVVIPVHEKDRAVLPHSVRSVLRQVAELGQLWVVSERPFPWPSDRVRWVPEPEPTLMPTASQVEARLASTRPGAERRANWLYQQLLKLGINEHIPELTPQYLVVDADVIFLREIWYELSSGTRFMYPIAGENHEPYRQAYERLLGRPPPVDYSMTAHHMLFDGELVSELRAEIEERHRRRWFEAYLDAVDPAQESSISEMDTYGWWVLERHPECARRHQLYWRDVPAVPGILGRVMLAEGFSFVTAHAWARRPRSWRLLRFLYRLALESAAALRPARQL